MRGRQRAQICPECGAKMRTRRNNSRTRIYRCGRCRKTFVMEVTSVDLHGVSLELRERRVKNMVNVPPILSAV